MKTLFIVEPGARLYAKLFSVLILASLTGLDEPRALSQCVGDCVIKNPTATQTIAQPNNTTLAVSSLELVLNADQFTGSTSNDLCDKVNAAFTYAHSVTGACGVVVNLPGGQVGPQICQERISIPTFSCAIAGATTGVRVILDGHGTALYASSGYSGDLIDVASTGEPYIPVEIKNIMVYGSTVETSVACGIYFNNVGGFHLHDFAVWGFAPGSGVCVDSTGGQSEGGLIENGDIGYNAKQIRYYSTDSLRSALYNTISNVHFDMSDVAGLGACSSSPYCNIGVSFEKVQTFGGKFDLRYNFSNNNQGAVVESSSGADISRAEFTLRGATTGGTAKNCGFLSADGAAINTTATILNAGLAYSICPYINPVSGTVPEYPQQSGYAAAISTLDTYWINEGGGLPQYRLGKWKNHGGGTFSNYGGGGDSLAINMSAADQGHDSSIQFTTRNTGSTTQTDELDEEVDQMQIGSGASVTLAASGGSLSGCTVPSGGGGQNYFNASLNYTISGCTVPGTVTFTTSNGIISGCSASGGSGCSSPTIVVTSNNAPVINTLFADANGNIGVGPGFDDTTGTQITGSCGPVYRSAITSLTRASGGSTTATLANSITIPASCYFVVEGAYDPNFNGIYYIGTSSFTGTSLVFSSGGTVYSSPTFLGGAVIGPVQFPQATLDVNGSFRLGSSIGGSTYTRLTTFTTGNISVASVAAGTCADRSYPTSTPVGVTLLTTDNEISVVPSQGVGNGTVTATAVTTAGDVTLHFCARVLTGSWTPTASTNYSVVAIH